MLKHVLHTFSLNLAVADLMLKDIPSDQMVSQPHGLINHPAWNLWHLVVNGHRVCQLLGIESSLPDGWEERLKAASPPTAGASKYPTKNELLDALRAVHQSLSEGLPGVDSSALDQIHPVEGARQYFPTVGDQAVYAMTAHEMDHLGQMAAWRRAQGLTPVPL